VRVLALPWAEKYHTALVTVVQINSPERGNGNWAMQDVTHMLSLEQGHGDGAVQDLTPMLEAENTLMLQGFCYREVQWETHIIGQNFGL
jgi:hypothetical protein